MISLPAWHLLPHTQKADLSVAICFCVELSAVSYDPSIGLPQRRLPTFDRAAVSWLFRQYIPIEQLNRDMVIMGGEGHDNHQMSDWPESEDADDLDMDNKGAIDLANNWNYVQTRF